MSGRSPTTSLSLLLRSFGQIDRVDDFNSRCRFMLFSSDFHRFPPIFGLKSIEPPIYMVEIFKSGWVVR